MASHASRNPDPVSVSEGSARYDRSSGDGCGHCPLPCSLSDASPDETLRGWPFVWRVLLALVLPCVTFIVTVVALSGRVGELAAVVCGVLACLSLAAVVSRLFRRCPAAVSQER